MTSTFLLESDIEPFHLFKKWFDEACDHPEIPEPNAISLSTVNKHGQPSARIVNLQDYTDEGFRFFTNYGSQKTQDLDENPNVAIVMYWQPLQRSIRIEGVARKVSREESEKVFHSLPRLIQIERFTSPQGQVVPDRKYLDGMEQDVKAKLGDDKEVPLPKWGGYLVIPRTIDFWQGRANGSLNDRIRFRKFDGDLSKINQEVTHVGENGWIYERLAP